MWVTATLTIDMQVQPTVQTMAQWQMLWWNDKYELSQASEN